MLKRFKLIISQVLRSSFVYATQAPWLVVIVVNVTLALPVLGCRRAFPTKVSMNVTDTRLQECRGVRIAAQQERFLDGFSIQYEITTSSRKRNICVPIDLSHYGSADLRAVALRPAGASLDSLMKFQEPVRFKRFAIRAGVEGGQPLGNPGLHSVARQLNAVEYEVPAGEYRLQVVFQPSSCHERVYEDACVAVSEPFVLEKATRFALEDDGSTKVSK